MASIEPSRDPPLPGPSAFFVRDKHPERHRMLVDFCISFAGVDQAFMKSGPLLQAAVLRANSQQLLLDA